MFVLLFSQTRMWAKMAALQFYGLQNNPQCKKRLN